jgi:hypothetical protein
MNKEDIQQYVQLLFISSNLSSTFIFSVHKNIYGFIQILLIYRIWLDFKLFDFFSIS